LTANNAPFVEEKLIKSPEMPPRFPSAWVFPDEMSAMKNCVRCSGGLTTQLGEVFVRFIALLSSFDRTLSPFCEGKVGLVT
jgi:hypothetical protein